MLLEKLSNLCKQNNTTFAEVERTVGIGNGTIGRWGNMNPRVDTLKKVADYFGVTLDELLRENEEEGE